MFGTPQHNRLSDVTRVLTTARSEAIACAIALPLVLLVKYGFGLHPQSFRFSDAAAQWPDVAGPSLLAVGDRALLSNSAPSWIAGTLQLTSENAYISLSAVFTLFAISGPLLLRMNSRNASFTRLYFIVAAGGALAPVLLMWVGGYDALLVCGLVLGVLGSRRWISLIGWVLAAITHSSVAVPAALLFSVYLMWNSGTWRQSFERRRAIDACVGAGLGYLAIHWLTDLWGGSTDRFTLFKQIPFEAILSSYANSLPVLIVSGIGIAWFLSLFGSIRRLRCTQHFYLLAMFTIALIPLIAVDQTRIIALCLTPVTLAWIETLSAQLSAQEVKKVWTRMLVPAILAPIGVVWMGITYWPYWL